MRLPSLEGLISDMLNLRTNNFKSLVETRVILEINSAMLSAKFRTEKNIYEIKEAFEAHKKKIKNGEYAIEEDLLFI